MGNKVTTMLGFIEEIAGKKALYEVEESCGVLGEKPTPASQGKYALAVLAKMDGICSEKTTRTIMKRCGNECISVRTIETAKKLYNESENMEDFLEKLNEKHIGGGMLHLQNEKIIAVYEKCYCGLVKAAKNMPGIYCSCSCGWFEKLFISVLGENIGVKAMSTITSGAQRCEFEITRS